MGAETADSESTPQVQGDALWHALEWVTQAHGRSINRDAAVAGLPLENGRLTPRLLPRAAERAGFDCAVREMTWRDIPDDQLPCIGILDGNRCCVIRKGTDGVVEALSCDADGVNGPLPSESCEAEFQNLVVTFLPVFQFDERAPETPGVKQRHWFWGVIGENVRLYRDVLVAAFLINLFALATPFFVMNVYDRVVPNRAIETLWMLAIGVAIVHLAELLLRTLRAYFIDLASSRVDVRLSAAIMERVLGMSLAHRPVAAGSFASNLRAFEIIRDFITSATVTTLIDLPFGLLFVVVVAWIGIPLAVPLVLGILLIFGFALLVQSRLHALTESSFRASAQRNATLIESLVGMETLKVLGAEGVMQRRWESAVAFLARVHVKTRALSSGTVHLSMWVQQLCVVLVVVIGVYLAGDNLISLGGIIAAMMLSSRALAPFGQMAGLLTQYHHAKTAMHALDQVMETPVERSASSRFISRPRLRGEIRFRDVSFRYPNQGVEALREVSFTIAPGEHVALLGRIGSGKTTIQKLIMGLYPPDQGAVLIDGIDLRQLDPAELRRQIGSVTPDSTLFYGTLRDNLTIANPEASDTEIVRAAEIGGIGSFVDQHPQGFDMVIGERGESLSSGQRQAAVLARACLGDPSILLLDEPTGAMDHSGEETVKRELRTFAADKTMLLVTHRTALLDLVSRIIVIDGGRIVADGPKAQVVEALRSGHIGKAG